MNGIRILHLFSGLYLLNYKKIHWKCFPWIIFILNALGFDIKRYLNLFYKKYNAIQKNNAVRLSLVRDFPIGNFFGLFRVQLFWLWPNWPVSVNTLYYSTTCCKLDSQFGHTNFLKVGDGRLRSGPSIFSCIGVVMIDEPLWHCRSVCGSRPHIRKKMIGSIQHTTNSSTSIKLWKKN